jgi:hypothetical protein
MREKEGGSNKNAGGGRGGGGGGMGGAKMELTGEGVFRAGFIPLNSNLQGHLSIQLRVHEVLLLVEAHLPHVNETGAWSNGQMRTLEAAGRRARPRGDGRGGAGSWAASEGGGQRADIPRNAAACWRKKVATNSPLASWATGR